MPTTKQQLRDRVWKLLRERRAARFPFPITDRIPNFVGAEKAAARVAELPEWTRAKRIKCNPDAPQRPLRLRALRDGKIVFGTTYIAMLLGYQAFRGLAAPVGAAWQARALSSAVNMASAPSPISFSTSPPFS